MKPFDRYFSFATHVAAALVVSLIVNFSYLLAMLTFEHDYVPPELREMSSDARIAEVCGPLHLNADGYGYITPCESDEDIDSVYVQRWRLRYVSINDGDIVKADAISPADSGAHFKLIAAKEVNGVPIDYGEVFNRPNYKTGAILQILFYLAMALLVTAVMTVQIKRSRLSFGTILKRVAICIVLTVGFYFLAPAIDRHTGLLRPLFFAHAAFTFDTVVILKCSFSLVAAILYSFIYMLIYQRQKIVIENERLKSENLATRYDMLVSQVNPHFFFNSLNSLATLVRENDSEKALLYIDRMSYTFRYILQNGRNMTVTLREELRFAEAYSYLFKIRYADKIFFDIEVAEEFADRVLPSLSLQPLIDNAVNHNAVTSRRPMRISIKVADDKLIVSNPKYPLLNPAAGTGIGLKNLSSRWLLITGTDIEVCDTPDTFTVKLPLLKSEEKI